MAKVGEVSKMAHSTARNAGAVRRPASEMVPREPASRHSVAVMETRYPMTVHPRHAVAVMKMAIASVTVTAKEESSADP